MSQTTENFCQKFKPTLGNLQWVQANETKIKEIFPQTWTHIENLNPVKIGFNLKLLGLDWRSNEEYARILGFLSHVKILLNDNYLIKANHRSIFKEPHA